MSDTSSEPFEMHINPLRDESNFYQWKGHITLYLKMLKLWPVVSGASPRPTTGDTDPWDTVDIQAQCVLTGNVSPDLCSYLHIFSTSSEMWKALMSRFHHRDPASLIRAFNALTTLQCNDDDSIAEFLARFNSAWMKFILQTSDAVPPVVGSENSLETVLKVVVKSENAKMEFLINSLPISLRERVQNFRLARSAELKYMDVYHYLMNIHDRQEAREKEEERLQKDCTWCRSRGFESVGHVWNHCGRLREFKIGNRKRGC